MPEHPGLDDAYALETPDDNRRLYRAWADTYESEFMVDHGYVYPAGVVGVFAGHAGDEDGPVLDVGCGTGVCGVEMAAHGSWTVDGLDISPEMLAKAAAKQGGGGQIYRRVIEADLTRPLELDEGAYGAVVSAGTFTHGHVGPEAIEELIRIVKPGGLLCLGINERFFEAHGFDAAFRAHVGSGRISTPEFPRIAMYDAAPDAHEHAADTAVVAVARKI